MITGEQLWDVLKLNGFELPVRKRNVEDKFDFAAEQINKMFERCPQSRPSQKGRLRLRRLRSR